MFIKMRKHDRKIKRRQNQGLTAFILFLVLLITVLGTGCAYYYLKYQEAQNASVETLADAASGEIKPAQNGSYTEEDVEKLLAQTKEETSEEFLSNLQELLETGDGTIHALQALYPDKIIMVDGNNYLFFDILPQLAKNNLLNENIVVSEERELTYVENGQVISKKGIDVSKFQGEIDWEAVRKDGVEYAYLRAGIRGYESGAIVMDETFHDNAAGALENGIEVGAYFFGQAVNEDEAVEEAEAVLEALEGYDINAPVVYDVEAVSSTQARTKDLTKEERTAITIAFCEKIRDAGYTPMIYGNVKTFMMLLDIEQLENYDKWFASYRDVLYFPYKIKLWQYTEKGSVDGIDGNVDLNISFY